MHANEVETDDALVGRLLAAQFPQWAELPITRVHSAGTDHVLYRVGSDLVVRLRRKEHVDEQVDKERTWLPRLAPLVPLELPIPLAKGEPGAGYPFAWSIYGWLEGENPVEGVADPAVASDLARFVTALRHIDATGGPPAGEQNFFRGAPLALRDEPTRIAIEELRGIVDTGAVASAWDEALGTPAWPGPPVWIHGDLTPENLLLRRGRMAAVIDFGCLGVGDPACDLLVAWSLLSGQGRRVFREEVDVDDDTWARGRGWALSTALIALPYYKDTNPPRAANARYRIREAVADRSSAR